MSELTDKLEYILDWLKSKGLESFDCYNPGLTQSEIDAILKDFPFNLSKELYELYQWRNGSPDLIQSNSCYGNEFLFPEQFYSYEPLYFCSLKDSIYMYKILWENGQLTQSMNEDLLTENYLDSDDSYWKKNWFPIGAFEFRRILYVVGGIDPSPVFLWDVDCIPVQVRIYKDIKKYDICNCRML